MKIFAGILLLGFVAWFDFQCAEGSEPGSHVIRHYVELQHRRRGRPYSQSAEAANAIEIREGSLVTLELADGSQFIGGLHSYGLLPPPWIYNPLPDEMIVYVRKPDGYGWNTVKLDAQRHPIFSDPSRKPRFVILHLPNGNLMRALLVRFNRQQMRLFRPRNNDKIHVFVTMPDGICYSACLRKYRS